MKSRRHIYLDEALAEQLEKLAARPGTTMSAIVGDALRAYFENKGASEIDERLRPRFDKFTRQLDRIERDVGIVMESLALFIRYELMVTAPIPDDDPATRALGHERFQSFLEQVCRRLAGSRTFHAELLNRVREAGEADHG